MPANKPRPDKDVNLDLSDVPMTPAMVAMSHVGSISRDLQAAGQIANEFLIDGAEAAWAEGQRSYDILKAQGKPSTHRTVFYNRLGKRGLTVGEGWRNRTSDEITEFDLPAYLQDPELAALADEAADVLRRLETLAEARAAQYDDTHQRVLRAVEERTPLGQAS